jgi:hypothetical protein
MTNICSWLQTGTYFYHRHFRMQRAAGLYGSLLWMWQTGRMYHENIYIQMAGLSSDPMRWIGETQVTISC